MLDGMPNAREWDQVDRMADRLDLVVPTFGGPIGETQFRLRKNAVEVAPQHAHEFLERFQTRMHRRVHPFRKVRFGAGRLPVIPEELKGFLEAVSSHDGSIPANESR